MNKIVRERYPVSALPDDLRSGLLGHDYVRVTIEGESAHPNHAKVLADLIARARQDAPINDDPVERIRKLRDEWDERGY
jgi:hypothetical protein